MADTAPVAGRLGAQAGSWPTCGPLSLVGMMAAGKSTVARAPGSALGWEVCDLDTAIIEAAGVSSISAIFAQCGEDGFRRLERETLHRVLGLEIPTVLAMGGGTPAQGDAMARITAAGPSVWLKTTAALAAQRAFAQGGRPLLAQCRSVQEAADRISELASTRERYYRQAWLTVEAGPADTPDTLAERILTRLGERPWQRREHA